MQQFAQAQRQKQTWRHESFLACFRLCSAGLAVSFHFTCLLYCVPVLQESLRARNYKLFTPDFQTLMKQCRRCFLHFRSESGYLSTGVPFSGRMRAVWPFQPPPTFRGHMSLPTSGRKNKLSKTSALLATCFAYSSTLKMEAESSSETLADI